MQRHNDIGSVTATNNSDRRDNSRAQSPGPGGSTGSNLFRQTHTHTFTKLHLPEDIKSLATTDCLLVNSSLFVGSTIGGTSPSKLILFNLDGV